MFAIPEPWLRDLDGDQRAVAAHGEEPLIVMAGAGTGKTRALVGRVAALIARDVPPSRILLLTFTRRAAEDMVARAVALTNSTAGERPVGGTFHSVAHHHLAAHAASLGLPTGFGLLDPSSAADLMDLLRVEHGMSGNGTRFPRPTTLVDIYSRAINQQRPLRQLVPAEFPWCEPHLEAMAELFRHFTKRKRDGALFDFDDLLLHWRALLEDPTIGPVIVSQFSYVLVDEYQDVNCLQADLIGLLAPGGIGLTVVGDEAQAIYGFRGSDPTELRRRIASHPDTRLIQLRRNFRAPQRLLDLANRVRPGDGPARLELVADRPGGPKPVFLRCYDAGSEARAVADGILSAYERGVPLRQQAVLVRAGHHSDLIELELSVRRVPYRKYGGLRFLEAAHVKDLMAALRLVHNAHDEVAWYRILRLHRHIGPSRARDLVTLVDPTSGDSLIRWPELVAAAPPQSRLELTASLRGLQSAREQTAPGPLAEAVLGVLRPLVEARYEDARVRLTDLDRLVASAYVADEVEAWLAELTLDPPAGTGDLAHDPHLDDDYVVISTIHSAKGLEWANVYLPQLLDGFLPLDMALHEPEGLEEERRLFYVAVTRAREELFLYAPLRMPHRRFGLDDRHHYAPISRFLDDQALATIEVREEQRKVPVLAQIADGKPAVDLDPLWA